MRAVPSFFRKASRAIADHPSRLAASAAIMIMGVLMSAMFVVAVQMVYTTPHGAALHDLWKAHVVGSALLAVIGIPGALIIAVMFAISKFRGEA